MPGNIITINSSVDLEWYVGDSKMEKLIKVLNKIGYKRERDEKYRDERFPNAIKVGGKQKGE